MNTGLPKAVQDQVDEAERIQAELMKAPEESEPASPPVEPPPELEKPKEPVVPQVSTDDTAYWKQRFDTVQGKYNAEVPRLHQNVRELTDRLGQMEKQLQKPADPVPQESLLTAQDVEDYGQDLIDVIRRAAKEETGGQASKVVQQLQAEVTELRQQLKSTNSTVAVSLEEQFYKSLASRVPDWEAVNKDATFLGWLSEIDTLSGKTRWDYLNDAHGRLDVERVATIFQTYKSALSAPAKAAASELQRQVAPAKSGAGGQGVDTSKRIWTQAEYSAVWDHRLSLKMSQKEIDALREEADTALAEGRLR